MSEYHGIAIFEDTTLIKPVIYMNAEFVFTGTFSKSVLCINHWYVMAAMICYKSL